MLNPLDLVRELMKLIAISSKRLAGIGIECRKPAGACVVDLLRAQDLHDWMKSLVSCSSEGQK